MCLNEFLQRITIMACAFLAVSVVFICGVDLILFGTFKTIPSAANALLSHEPMEIMGHSVFTVATWLTLAFVLLLALVYLISFRHAKGG